WRAGDHPKAVGHMRRKEELYRLKEQALEHLIRDEVLNCAGWHEFPGGLIAEIIAGDGYRFHRPTKRAPAGKSVPKLREIEAKPLSADDVPVNEAVEAVRGFLQNRDKVAVFRWPARKCRAGDDWDQEDYWLTML